MGTISLNLPVVGQPNSTEDPKISSALTTLQNLVNGNIDGANTSAAFNQSAGVNGAGIVKGVCVNAGPGTRTNVAYGALNDAPDQVAGIVLPTNGLITVWYQAQWQETVSGASRAAIFVGGNQLKIATPNSAAVVQETSNGGTVSSMTPISSFHGGLVGALAGVGSYLGDVTTGQAVTTPNFGTGGPCYIFAAAGTYTISVQFKASSGTVTASSRKLWVKAESFA